MLDGEQEWKCERRGGRGGLARVGKTCKSLRGWAKME